jgi:hypothetical protein
MSAQNSLCGLDEIPLHVYILREQTAHTLSNGTIPITLGKFDAQIFALSTRVGTSNPQPRCGFAISKVKLNFRH